VNKTDEILVLEKEKPLAWLKLNRPKQANSLNRALLTNLQVACEEIASDQSIQVVAIIGSGVKIFSAGADLTERLTMSPSEVVEYHALIQKTMLAIESLPQPVIAAINGSAYGGGTELALACDLRVMVSSATLQLTEVRLGIIPGAGGTQRLPRLIGIGKAKEMIFTACPVSAQEACRLGLVNKVVQEKASMNASFHEPLINEVRAWAKEIARAAPLALRQAKVAINSGCNQNLLSGLEQETKAYLKLLDTKDRLEGLTAFAEKRQPQYKGQ